MKTKKKIRGKIAEIIIREELTPKEQTDIEVHLAKKYGIKHPYDHYQKGLKYDTLNKEYNDLKILCDKALEQRLKAEIQRDKLWDTLDMAQGLVEMLINATPTSVHRNQLCEKSIMIEQTLKNNEK